MSSSKMSPIHQPEPPSTERSPNEFHALAEEKEIETLKSDLQDSEDYCLVCASDGLLDENRTPISFGVDKDESPSYDSDSLSKDAISTRDTFMLNDVVEENVSLCISSQTKLLPPKENDSNLQWIQRWFYSSSIPTPWVIVWILLTWYLTRLQYMSYSPCIPPVSEPSSPQPNGLDKQESMKNTTTFLPLFQSEPTLSSTTHPFHFNTCWLQADISIQKGPCVESLWSSIHEMDMISALKNGSWYPTQLLSSLLWEDHQMNASLYWNWTQWNSLGIQEWRNVMEDWFSDWMEQEE